MSEWKIKIRVQQCSAGYQEFETEFNDAIPDHILPLLIAGSIGLHVRGCNVYGVRPVVDFAKRTVYLSGETYDTPTETP